MDQQICHDAPTKSLFIERFAGRECVVYGLKSSGSDEIRYIGQTTAGIRRRFLRHLQDAMAGNDTYACRWIRSVIDAGFELEVIILDRNAVWGVTEMRLISEHKASGARLVNSTAGGDGTIGWRPSEEQRQKLSAALRGKKVPQQVIDKIRATVASNGGRKVSRQTAEKISMKLTGKKLSAETIEKRTATRRANGGYVASAAHKEKLSKKISEWWAKRKEQML